MLKNYLMVRDMLIFFFNWEFSFDKMIAFDK